ncbi:MarR family winged helix-turn-helix transcriptional regulator [Methylobacterium sp. J-030]|uniref:MarR family winged helix-turn-helix transcriptional regulator n=1 Tax=Methylobacterium sp. J-030 TaxID=2836627 RepID=UPI001FB9E772|nr:MarR family winged helix-turn-helix transcriptional regulator [Methylobacterium sp. J-030]MCJ2068661.1 MarR family winged helix-turn-helix transcriptional regulator [Methylobacterium sp. J-030]
MTTKAGQGNVSDILSEISSSCVLLRTRLISRVITAIHDEALATLGIGSAQFVLLAVIGSIAPASRADIGRFHRQDRSTLSRNLKVIVDAGWVEEDLSRIKGRTRPLVLTEAGKALLSKGAPAWRTAQAESKRLLGESGTVVVTDIANRILGGA